MNTTGGKEGEEKEGDGAAGTASAKKADAESKLNESSMALAKKMAGAYLPRPPPDLPLISP